MILLDTQIWIWWVTQSGQMPSAIMEHLNAHRAPSEFGVSEISVWEVAKKVERGKLRVGRTLDEWLGQAVVAPGVEMLPVTAAEFIESTRLPGVFHRDPADQIIVACARRRGLSLLTSDRQIRAYPHVELVRF